MDRETIKTALAVAIQQLEAPNAAKYLNRTLSKRGIPAGWQAVEWFAKKVNMDVDTFLRIACVVRDYGLTVTQADTCVRFARGAKTEPLDALARLEKNGLLPTAEQVTVGAYNTLAIAIVLARREGGLSAELQKLVG